MMHKPNAGSACQSNARERGARHPRPVIAGSICDEAIQSWVALDCLASARNDELRRPFRHILAPPAERGDIARAVQRRGLDDKAFNAAAVGEAYGADR